MPLSMLTLRCFSTAVPPAMLLQVGCAKRHTVVLTSDGEPLTWGHRIVTPRRVQVRSAHMPVRHAYSCAWFSCPAAMAELLRMQQPCPPELPLSHDVTPAAHCTLRLTCAACWRTRHLTGNCTGFTCASEWRGRATLSQGPPGGHAPGCSCVGGGLCTYNSHHLRFVGHMLHMICRDSDGAPTSMNVQQIIDFLAASHLEEETCRRGVRVPYFRPGDMACVLPTVDDAALPLWCVCAPYVWPLRHCCIQPAASLPQPLVSGGAVLTWASADPQLRAVEVLGALAGKRAACVSASKLRTAVATERGEVYVWETRPEVLAGTGGGRAPSVGLVSSGAGLTGGQLASGSSAATGLQAAAGVVGASPSPSPSPSLPDKFGVMGEAWSAAVSAAQAPPAQTVINPVRVAGLQRVATLNVGEKHTLALVSWALPPLPNRDGFVSLPGSATVTVAEAGARGRATERGSAGRRSRSSSLDGWDLRSDSGDSDGGGAGQEEHGSGSAPPIKSHTNGQGGGEGQGRLTTWASKRRPLTAALGLVAGPPASGGGGGFKLPAPPSVSQYAGTYGDADSMSGPIDNLQTISQKAVAQQLVEPRTVLSLLEYADACGTALLRAYCIAYCLQNLDAVLAEARGALEALPPHLTAELEQHWKAWMAPADQHPSHPLQVQQPASGMNQLPSRGDDASMLALGASPPLGTSPPLGSSPPSGISLGGRAGSLTTGAWLDVWQGAASVLGSSPVAGSFVEGRALPGRGGGRPRQHLQAGCRPTAAPRWLAGKTAVARVSNLPVSSLPAFALA